MPVNTDQVIISKMILTVVIFITTYVAVRFLAVVFKRSHAMASRRRSFSSDDLNMLETRFDMMRRLVNVSLYFFACILVLLQFDSVRSLGAGLLATTGIASIVLGLAAQDTLSNLIAGIVLSFSQTIRLHDAVMFDKEFGTIQEISLMRSIILTWDNRKIIVPNSIMAKKVIENWSIRDTTLVGTVLFYVDYTCDIDKIRAWAKEVVNKSQNSTAEKLTVVQVVDFTEKAMVVRILVKGPDPTKTWDLRCEVRENLIKKFQEAGLPLPQIRVEFKSCTLS